jgi:hypothetical protein
MHQNCQGSVSKLEAKVQHVNLSLVAKNKEQYAMLTLDSCVITIVSFDLWMFRSRHDTFGPMINFINS